MPLPTRRDLLPGTLDMLILKSLTAQAMHGYGLQATVSRGEP